MNIIIAVSLIPKVKFLGFRSEWQTKAVNLITYDLVVLNSLINCLS